MPYSIYLVDDHPIILRSLRDVLEGDKHSIVGEAGSIAVAREQILAMKPDVSIIDINLEDGSGLDLIESLHEENPDINVVVYSMRDNIQTIALAYRAGAKSYVPKTGDPMELLPAIDYAAHGKIYFVGDIAERLAVFHATSNPSDPAKILTDREFQIFMEAAHGLEIDDIAKKLEINPGSVSNRLVSIRKKLGLKNSVEFALLAVKHGHITQDDL